MGKGLEKISEPIKVVRQFIFTTSAISLAYIGYGVSGVLVGHILALGLASCIALFYIFKSYDLRYVLKTTGNGFPSRELLFFNFNTIILVLLSTSLYNVDILLLRPLTGGSTTGYYKAALVIAEFLWFVPFALQTALLHSTSELWSNEKVSKIETIASRATRYSIIFTLLLVIGVSALANPFMPIYFGTEFTQSIVPLLLLLPGAFCFANARPIIAIGQGKGAIRSLIKGTGAAAAINLVLNLLLIPRYEMVGAAIATSIGYGSMFIFHVYIARRIGYDPLGDIRLKKIILTAMISSPVIYGIAYLLVPRFYSIIIVPPIGLIVYSISAIKTRAVDPEEIIDVLEQLPSPIRDIGPKIVIMVK